MRLLRTQVQPLHAPRQRSASIRFKLLLPNVLLETLYKEDWRRNSSHRRQFACVVELSWEARYLRSYRLRKFRLPGLAAFG
jgi:hypothetical protein